jgi:hypothetical protein
VATLTCSRKVRTEYSGETRRLAFGRTENPTLHAKGNCDASGNGSNAKEAFSEMRQR